MTATNATTFDRRIADWLAGDPNEAPETVLSSVLEAVPTVRQRRVVGGRWSSRRRDRQRLAAAFGGIATIGLVVFAVAMIERGNESVGPSAPTTASPAATAESTATRAFHSTFNRYTARYPADWSLDGATTVWAPTLDDVVQAAAMDVYAPVPNARGFVAASTQLDGGLSIDDWIEQTLPTRQRPSLRACDNPSAAGVSMGLPPETWQPIRLGGHEARERDSCYAIDVVVLVGRRVYLFTGASPRPAMTPPVERATFDAFLASITFDDEVDPTPAPTPSATPAPTPVELTESWTSPRYGYSARIPSNWTVRAATVDASFFGSTAFPDRFDRASIDVYLDEPVERMWVASTPFAPGADLDAWIAVHLPPRQQAGGQCANIGGLPAEIWTQRTVADLPARERDACRHIDVVVAALDRVYVISARSTSIATTPADRRRIVDAILGSLQLRPDEVAPSSPPSTAPSTSTFTSGLYGYSIEYPSSLDAYAGTTTWKAGEPWHIRWVADTFDGLWRRFSVVSARLPAGVSVTDWIDRNVQPGTGPCPEAPAGTWNDGSVAEHDARIRIGRCVVDAVVVVAERVYVLSWRTSQPGPDEHGDLLMSSFETFADTIRFDPGAATAP